MSLILSTSLPKYVMILKWRCEDSGNFDIENSRFFKPKSGCWTLENTAQVFVALRWNRGYSSAHKDYCRRGPGLHEPPYPGSQREARPGQSMPGSEELEESKSCQRCIIDEVERREGAKRIWLPEEASTNIKKKRKKEWEKKEKTCLSSSGVKYIIFQNLFMEMRIWTVISL